MIVAGEYAVVGLFAAWAAASVLVYIPKLRTPIRVADIFTFVPEWRFFAPRPATFDYTLLYRDGVGEKEWGQWHELVQAGPRRWWHFAWNPHKRTNKALFDLAGALAKHARARDPELELSVPYLALLHAVSTQPRTFRATETQFLIMAQDVAVADAEARVMFMSDPHPL